MCINITTKDMFERLEWSQKAKDANEVISELDNKILTFIEKFKLKPDVISMSLCMYNRLRYNSVLFQEGYFTPIEMDRMCSFPRYKGLKINIRTSEKDDYLEIE